MCVFRQLECWSEHSNVLSFYCQLYADMHSRGVCQSAWHHLFNFRWFLHTLLMFLSMFRCHATKLYSILVLVGWITFIFVKHYLSRDDAICLFDILIFISTGPFELFRNSWTSLWTVGIMKRWHWWLYWCFLNVKVILHTGGEQTHLAWWKVQRYPLVPWLEPEGHSRKGGDNRPGWCVCCFLFVDVFLTSGRLQFFHVS